MDDQDFRRLTKTIILLKDTFGAHTREFDRVIDIFIENGIFSFNKKEQIYSGKTDSERIDIFLKCLKGSGPRAYEVFRSALLGFKDAGFNKVVSALDNIEPDSSRGAWQGDVPRLETAPRSMKRKVRVEQLVAEKTSEMCETQEKIMESQRKMMESQCKLQDDFQAALNKMMNQNLESQDQLRKDFLAEFECMNSKIESLQRSKEEAEEKYSNDMSKVKAEKIEWEEKSSVLKKQIASLHEQLRETKDTILIFKKKNRTLVKENEKLKSQSNLGDKKHAKTKNNAMMNDLENEKKKNTQK